MLRIEDGLNKRSGLPPPPIHSRASGACMHAEALYYIGGPKILWGRGQ